ncbi:MAG: NnrS family protein [Bdellovibrionota bacterium]
MRSNPYKLLFPIGLCLSIWGALLWIGFAFDWFHSYPGTLHADVMMGGFLFCFASGFLVTAVPRFTGSDIATTGELFTIGGIGVAVLTSSFFEKSNAIHVATALGLICLISFGLRRFRSRSFDPPPPFLFVGFGLISGLFGIVISILADFQIVTGSLILLGRLFYLHGMMLSLVLGVGSRLIPALLGWAELPKVQISQPNEKPAAFMQAIPKFIWINVIALAVSFPIEVFANTILGRGLRAAACTWIAIGAWKIHRLPRERTRLSWGLWFSCWLMLLGLLGNAALPAYGAHFLHLTFIGGFGLMTLMIASRVILSHGGHDTELEERSKAIRYATVFIVLAALTRAAAPLTPAIYQSHLTYAAVCWILGLTIWGSIFMTKIFQSKDKEESAEHC